MRKILIMALGGMSAAVALAQSPTARGAEPITLTSAQMDAVTAGRHSGRHSARGRLAAKTRVVSNQPIKSVTISKSVKTPRPRSK